VKGARDLSPRQAAVLGALFVYREREAERLDRPPFKVMAEGILMALVRRTPSRVESDVIAPRTTLQDLARHAPRTRGDLATIRDFGPWRQDARGRDPGVPDRFDVATRPCLRHVGLRPRSLDAAGGPRTLCRAASGY